MEAFRRQPVQMRGLDMGMPPVADNSGMVLIRHDHQNIPWTNISHIEKAARYAV
jgi:hypothetical protein